LIPLSDARLRPKNHSKTAIYLVLFAVAIAMSVFFTVPRAVSLGGDFSMKAESLAWNESKEAYTLTLNSSIPIYNPNFFPVYIQGSIKVLFYDAEAGSKVLKEPIRIPPRSSPFLLEDKIDASGVPSDYILSILSQCSTFPHVLTFFIQGKLSYS